MLVHDRSALLTQTIIKVERDRYGKRSTYGSQSGFLTAAKPSEEGSESAGRPGEASVRQRRCLKNSVRSMGKGETMFFKGKPINSCRQKSSIQGHN